MNLINGIDVYSGTGLFDGSLLVQEKAQFLWVKLSQGTWYFNPLALQQAQVGWMLNIPVGFFHYFEPSTNTGAAEADWVLQCLGKIGGIRKDVFLGFDSEYGLNRGETDLAPNADLRAHHLDALGTIKRILSLRAFLYSSRDYLSAHNLIGGSDFADYRLWLAEWGSTPPVPVDGWQTLMWQYNTDGVDRDYLMADSVAALKEFSWGDQPDPLAGKAVGTADVSGDVPTILKRILADAQAAGQTTIAADAALALQAFGLLP